jgi:hypothetical protein
MSIILYFFTAFTLLRFAFSPSYRSLTGDRWKKTPTHLVIYEIGGGFMGLILLGVLLWLVLARIG